jgi:hypothetical protein
LRAGVLAELPELGDTRAAAGTATFWGISGPDVVVVVTETNPNISVEVGAEGGGSAGLRSGGDRALGTREAAPWCWPLAAPVTNHTELSYRRQA